MEQGEVHNLNWFQSPGKIENHVVQRLNIKEGLEFQTLCDENQKKNSTLKKEFPKLFQTVRSSDQSHTILRRQLMKHYIYEKLIFFVP